MDDFYNNLYRQLQRYGYMKFQYQGIIYAQKEQEDRTLLLRIVPEQLPGQKAVNLLAEHQLLEQIERNIMVTQGRKVESMMLVIRRAHPDSEVIEEVDSFDNVWLIDRDHGQIFIYENQKTDFYGLEKYLEDVLIGWLSQVKTENRKRLQNTFTPVNTAIIIANVLVFLILTILGDTESADFAAKHGGLVYNYLIEGKEYYRLFTSMFYHFGIEHLGGNMLMLLLTGSIVERHLGKVSYTFLYLIAGLVSSLGSLWFTLRLEPAAVSGGASGAVFGVMGALAAIIFINFVLRGRKRVEGITLWRVLLLIAMSGSYGFLVSDVDNAAHICGLLAGFIVTLLISLVYNVASKKGFKK